MCTNNTSTNGCKTLNQYVGQETSPGSGSGLPIGIPNQSTCPNCGYCPHCGRSAGTWSPYWGQYSWPGRVVYVNGS